MAKRGGYIPIPDELAARTDLAPGHKLVMGILARLQGDKATCWPGYDYLAAASGMSRRHVIRIVTDLRTRKEITVLNFPYQSNSYAVPFATAKALRKKWAVEKQTKKTA